MVETAVVELRTRERIGRDQIAVDLGVPARTVSRILVCHGLPHLAALDPITGQVIRASKVTAVRYERDRPGELVHMDVKKIGRIPEGGGWRAGVIPQGGKSSAQKKVKVGFDYVHSVVDDHSRFTYSEILPHEKGETCVGFLARAIAEFAAHGITPIEELMTDNALAYRYSLREICATHAIKQVFIRPHCPWQNGKVERLHRTMQTEWASRRIFTSNDERTAALAPWLEHYNTRRRHSAIGGLPPISRLTPTRWPGTSRAQKPAPRASAIDIEAAIASTPAGRSAEPADVAGAVAILASHDAAYVPGSILTLDGSRSAITPTTGLNLAG